MIDNLPDPVVPIRLADGNYCLLVTPKDWPVVVILLLDEDLMPVGAIRWLGGVTPDRDDSTGMVGMIDVDPRYRRRGIATKLWNIASGIADDCGWTPPTHADQRTEEGEAWALSLGAKPADSIIELS